MPIRYLPVISATGRFVAFASQASNLAPDGVPYQPAQVFVHDRDVNGNGIFDEPGSRATSVVSVSPGGGRADDWTSNIRISGDGRVVLFESRATNLVPGTPGGTNHVYVHDRQLQQTTLVDRGVTGGPASWGAEPDSSDLSDDGRYVTFSSVSPDFAPDLNGAAQVFRHDRADPTPNATVIVSRRPDGVIADDSTYSTAISGDGRYVVLRTVATNLASPSPVEGRGSVIVRDMVDGTLTRVDVIGEGSALNHWSPYNVSISSDGTAVAFNSDATNLVYLAEPGPAARLRRHRVCRGAGVRVVPEGRRHRVDRRQHPAADRLERGQPRSVDHAVHRRGVRRRTARRELYRRGEPCADRA